jgi:multiple sugar transport system substrate-binding protein
MTSRQKTILFVIIGIIIGFIILSVVWRRPSTKLATLEMWGIYDSPAVINSLINSFSQQHKNISIHYTQKETASYYDDLIKSFASNKAPDIFILPGNWLPIFQDKINALDLNKDKDFNLRLLNETYPQIVQDDLVSNNSLLGIPLSIDTLALYYNKDIFDYYKIPLPPQTWEDILKLVPKLRKTNPQGQITRAAIALGTSDNINWSPDILSELMMKLSSSMVDKQNAKITFDDSIIQNNTRLIPGVEALKGYTQFANPKSKYYTWGNNFPNAIYAFAQGKTVMIISYNLAQQIIKQESPDLRYGITPFPFLGFENIANQINYGRTMNAVVSNRSQSQQAAWQFLKYLSSQSVSQFYFSQTKNPPARLDLISSAMKDSQAGIFASQILTSRNWYQFDFQKINSLFSKMINDVILGNISAEQAVSSAVSGIELEWQKQLTNQ